MNVDGWMTVLVVAGLLVALVRNIAPPDILFLAASVLLAALGVITVSDAFAGFANEGMLTVAMLFVVAAGLHETGVLRHLGNRILGSARGERGAILRLSGVIVPMSAFLNNTPIVAMFVPIVSDWCRRHSISPSRLLIPVSFLAILGGTCTLIGTSTNLVVHGLMLERGLPGLGLFELGKVGVLYAAAGMVYLLLLGPRLLPDRKELLELLSESRREYLAEMLVTSECSLVGQTVEVSGLHLLPGLYIIEIDRKGTIIGPVRQDDVIQEGDRLVIAGIVSSILELDKIRGLIPVADPSFEIGPQQQRTHRLCEAVISRESPLIGKTIQEANFRSAYGAAVLAVHRGGRRIQERITNIRFRSGDTLLLQTRPHFIKEHRNDPSFYLVSTVEEWRPVRADKAWLAGGVFLLLIAGMGSGWLPPLIAASLAAVAMVGFQCISVGEARKSVEFQVLVTIAAAFGVGTALQNSGVAELVAGWMVTVTQPLGPLAALVAIYLVVSLFTELITNNAAAVLMFPFCLETARIYEVNAMPFLVAMILAASASFMTPIGYQTNMMVYGPGGYRFGDFFRIGAPLNLLLLIVAALLVPRIWPF